ncbi:regakine-1-like [Hippopotamus amphibius kiboko]|uniref:regakine-1-like n=1 Tax=Hippopotamus amphibius kiboko TaxID=575201 RepID=UPI00259522CE|nr:regakine-1-like [Hippopotamus amphibius kiboko]
MRVSLATLAFLLTLAALHSEADKEPADNVTVCCVTYTSRRIPLSYVKNYERTSDQCSKPAVIFQTKRGKLLCADPGEAWVQKSIEYLDRKSREQ